MMIDPAAGRWDSRSSWVQNIDAVRALRTEAEALLFHVISSPAQLLHVHLLCRLRPRDSRSSCVQNRWVACALETGWRTRHANETPIRNPSCDADKLPAVDDLAEIYHG